jgi:hypothetical protein
MARIIELQAENFKRLRALTIHPDRNVVVLNGPNRAGKSSALDAIWAALGGKSASPDEPVRRGERKAKALVRLDNGLTIERTWSTTDGTRLVVRDGDGARLASPQTLLDRLTESLAFDPLKFASMRSDEQVRLLRQLTGCDTSDLDTQRAAVYQERADLNRALRVREADLAGRQSHPDTPEREVSVAELSGRLRDAQQAESMRGKLQSIAERERDEAAKMRAQAAELQRRADALEASSRENADAAEQIDGEDTATLLVRLEQAEETNRMVRDNAMHAQVSSAVIEMRAKAAALTAQIEAIDEARRERIANASFPVDGLGFSEGTVTYQDLPLSQASHAERVRISAAIGLALHPELRVLLIRDAEKLDAEGMRLIADLAAQHDAQLWLERAGHSDPGAVVIEDGEVSDG